MTRYYSRADRYAASQARVERSLRETARFTTPSEQITAFLTPAPTERHANVDPVFRDLLDALAVPAPVADDLVDPDAESRPLSQDEE